MRILISRLSALGDCVCTLPVASALKTTYPECHITWAVDPRFAGIIECSKYVDEIVKVKPGFKPSSWPKIAGEFEFALDMQGLTKSGLVVAFAKSKQKIGYHWQRELAPLFSSKVLPDATSIHIVDQYVDVARFIGSEVDRADFGMAPMEEDRAKMQSLLAENGISGPFVIANAGAGWITKRWPPEHFARLAELLLEKGIQMALLGGKSHSDIEAAEAVCGSTNVQIAKLLGKSSVRELVALISLANAHVGGDTGSTHVAAALGVPAVGLYSITKPERSCPYGQISRCHYNAEGLKHIDPISVFGTVWVALG